MNLMKFFNFKFLKEEIKSKSQLIYSILALLPILQIFYFVLQLANHNYGIVSFSSLGGLSKIACFIIPFILAYALFGFLHKKNSVDFYLSKPIERKTMYFTNIIGGLFLIIILLLLNSIVMLLFNIFTPFAIPFKLIIDYFVFYTASFSFVFMITSLSIILAGNFLSTIVVLLLISLMYPFTTLVDIAMNQNHNVYLELDNCEEDDCNQKLYPSLNEYNYTTIYSPLMNVSYDSKSVLKTYFLTIIYIGLGYLAFEKRKMEDNECSFKNIKTYYMVKILTFLPVCFLSYALITTHDLTALIIAIAIPLAYYILYDLVMQKGYRTFKLTLITLCLSYGVFVGFFALLGLLYTKEVYLKQIDELVFDHYYYNGIVYYEDLVIKDPKVIKNIINSQDNSFSEYSQSYYITLKANNKLYEDYLYWPENNKIIDDYIDQNNIKSMDELYQYNKTKYINFNTNKTIKVPITNIMLEHLKNAPSVKDTYGINYNLYYYDNHKYYDLQIPINATNELLNYASKQLNQSFIKDLDLINESYINIDLYDLDEDITKDFNNFLLNRFIIDNKRDELKEFLKKHQNDEIKENTGVIILSDFNSKNNQDNIFIISNIEEFKNNWEKWMDSLADNKEYQKYVKEFENSYAY